MASVIIADQLIKRFGSFTAVDRISFEVEAGEVFGFLGANGAGKTTAMKMLCGLLRPSSGKAWVAGYDVYTQTEAIKRNIGYMSQKFSLYEDLTVKENIRFFGGIYGLDRDRLRVQTDKILDELVLRDRQNQAVRTLPLGWKQGLAFSLALIHEPRVVFLDEPTGGVDPITRRNFWERIYLASSAGITLFVTTHYMDEAEYCGRVCIMSEGKLSALDSPQHLKQIFQVQSMDEVFRKLARNTDE